MPLIHLQGDDVKKREPEYRDMASKTNRLERERELKRLMINDYSSLVAIYKDTFAIRDDIPRGTTATAMVQLILDQEFLDELE